MNARPAFFYFEGNYVVGTTWSLDDKRVETFHMESPCGFTREEAIIYLSGLATQMFSKNLTKILKNENKRKALRRNRPMH